MEKLNEIAKQLIELKPSEAEEILSILDEDYGITTPETMLPVINSHLIIEEEVQTIFDVILESEGAQKLKVVKLVKDLTGIPLREAKSLVDETPTTIMEGVDEGQAKEYKRQLTEMGAVVSIK
jgi:large subunit ribosomal protein L7/L12